MVDLDGYDKLYVNGFFCRSDLEQLVTRLRQAERDAARWRKLANSPDSSLTLRIHNSRCDQRDAVIDEAMK